MPEFIHLHNHTHYSLLDGACSPKSLVEATKSMNMNAVALTDHGNMFGALEFYLTALESGIKPIIGMETYVAIGSRFDRPHKRSGRNYYHLTLLAKNFTGYKNLIKLTTKGYLEGFYYRPRVDWELLEKHTDGLIGLSGCLKGEIIQLLLNGKYEEAKGRALYCKKIFNDDFYIELHDHGIEEERTARSGLIKIARELEIPLVAANDIHYILKDHARAQEILLCIKTGKNLQDKDRMKFASPEMYFKSFDEMHLLFRDVPEALTNTLKIAELCTLDIPLGKPLLPKFPLPDNAKDIDSFMAELARKGLLERYQKPTQELWDRLEYELSIIAKMGFSGYFLIVKDFIDFARSRGIPVGPGRGSAAGSLVSYCLGITNLDPIKYGLIFERFLNPERISMPDIDIDFCDDRRDEIIQYVIQKYGKENVAQIITFGSMNARAVIRDVGRALGIPYGDVDHIAKLIPEKIGISLDEALSMVPELKDVENSAGEMGDLIKQAKVLEGTVRHASTHAAGVVISPEPLTEYLPLYQPSQSEGKENGENGEASVKKGEITTQYSMSYVEKIGLLKMDFLGLRTLTVINDTIRMLASRGVVIDVLSIPLDDLKTFELFGRGETTGIFQFESSGMREYLKKLKPESLDDLTAMNALYRPGPMDMIDDFIQRKQGRKKIEYLHPMLEPILKETYGVIVYQEQVIRIASELGGFSLGKGDYLRRAMGKKIKDVMAAQREEFVAGARMNGIPKKIAEEIFALMDKFAGYGFNKSHAAGYALVAYQTAYLKVHYPAEFLAATLSSEMNRTDRILIFIEECKRLGCQVLPPDVNTSQWDFSVVNGAIRFGLGAIKNVGKSAVESIIQARRSKKRFTTIFELCDLIDLRLVNKKVLESLIVSGAADSLEGNRAQKMAAVEMAISYGQSIQLEREQGQCNMFSMEEMQTAPVFNKLSLPKVDEWNTYRKLMEEKDVLGFYISGHPLSRFEMELGIINTSPLNTIKFLGNNTVALVGGIITSIKTISDKNNKLMAFITLEDFSGTAECIAFAELFGKYRLLFQQDAMVLIKGKVSSRGEEDAKIICEDVTSLEKVLAKYAHSFCINLELINVNRGVLDKILNTIRKNPGKCPLYFNLKTEQNEIIKLHSLKFQVEPDKEFIKSIQDIVGKKNICIN